MKTKKSRMVGQLTVPFLILSMLVLSVGMAQATSPSISIIPPSTTVNQSDAFSVALNVDPAGNRVEAVDIKLIFDPAVVQLDSVVMGSFLGSSPLELFNDVDNTTGTLHLAHTIKAHNPAVNASGTYATLNFRVKSNAPNGTSALALTNATLANDTGINIPGVVKNSGTVTVNPPSGGGGVGGGGGTPSISIIPPSTTVNQSDAFSVALRVDPAGNMVMGVDIMLKFDPAVVQLDGVVIGSFLGSSPLEIQNNTDNTNGTLRLAHTVKGRNPAVNASGTYATLNFMVKSNAPNGTSALALTNATLANDTGINIPGVVRNSGTVTVNPPTKSWRFISVPYILNNSNVTDALSGTDYDMLFAWDPVGKNLKGSVTKLVPLQGYLIHMNTMQQIPDLEKMSGPIVPPFLDVIKGWNLIGTPGNITLDAETMLGSIDTSYFSIWDWNVPMQNYDEIGINGKTGLITPPPPVTIEGTDVFSMHPKVSYWVWATHNDTLVAFSP